MSDTITKTAAAESTKYRIRIVHDSDARNIFKEDDGHYPLMYEYGRNEENDFSEGEIDEFLQRFLNDNQLIYHQKRVLKLIQNDWIEEQLQDADDKFEKMDLLRDGLHDFIGENIENKVEFCKEFDIVYYHGNSTGYSQGDWANVLIVPTENNAKDLGYNLKTITEDKLKSTFDLFGYWAWGDVYGFIIEKHLKFTKVYEDEDEEDEEDEEWEEVDSCWGFYGREGDKNGMVDNIDFEQYGWTAEQLIELINDAEVEYSN